MPIRFIHLLSVVTLLFCCCSGDNSREVTGNLKKYLTNISAEENFRLMSDVYIVSPVEACGPCIEEMMAFIKENLDNKEIQYVLTHSMRKPIFFKITEEEVLEGNILIDDKGLASSAQLIENNPPVYYVRNGEVQSFTHIKPGGVQNELQVIHDWLMTNN